MGPGSCPGSGWALGPLRGSWPRGSPPPAAGSQGRGADREQLPPSIGATCGPGLLCARFGHILRRATVGPGSPGHSQRGSGDAPKVCLCPCTGIDVACKDSPGRCLDGGGPLHHGGDRHRHRQREARTMERIGSSCRPPAGPQWGPAASRPWPGPWALPPGLLAARIAASGQRNPLFSMGFAF